MIFLRSRDQLSILVLILILFAVSNVRYYVSGEQIDLANAPEKTMLFVLDINRADASELMQLPNIGETLSERIIEHRTENGPFENHEALLNVKGIGPKTLEKIRPFLLDTE